MTKKTLIHSALLCECQPLINFYKLKQNRLITDFKIYENNDIIVIVSGIGKVNTIKALEFVFKNYHIQKAINLGIAGCKDNSIQIGSLFCTNKFIKGINNTTLTTIDKPLDDKKYLNTTLVDMEAKYFLDICNKYIDNIIILKVVSDYLDKKIPKKAFIIDLMQQSFKQWKNLI